MPEVSIIIVNYNGLTLLDQCLESLEKFTNDVSYEIIVVDNNSTEGNVSAVVNKYKNTFLIENEKNLGYGAANNIGSRRAKGKYLLILNNDVLFIESSIKLIMDFVKKGTREVIVGCRLLNNDSTYQISVSAFPTIWNTVGENFFLYKIFPRSKLLNKYYFNYIELQETQPVDVVKGAFLFFSKESFEKLNGFDERFYFYSEETDFCYRFKKEIGEVLYYPFTSVIHFGGATTDDNLWYKFKNQCIAHIQLYQKHFTGMKFLTVVFSHYLGLILRSIFYLIGGIISFNKGLIIKAYYFFRQIFVYPKNLFIL